MLKSIYKHYCLHMTTGQVANYKCSIIALQTQHTNALVFLQQHSQCIASLLSSAD